MTNQEAFDQAVRGLKSQGWSQSLDRGCCSYNGPGGLHCGIGWLLRGVPIEPRLNAMSIANLLIQRSIVANHLAGCDRGFLIDLQKAHDRAVTPAYMRSRLFSLAETWGLSPAELFLDHQDQP